jgi:hypothetical protein
VRVGIVWACVTTALSVAMISAKLVVDAATV